MLCLRFIIGASALCLMSLNVHGLDSDIFSAAEQGNLDVVKGLVEGNSQLIVAADSRGYTLLHKAAYNNRLNVVEFLLSKGADINALSSSGSTPLHGAASYGHIEVVRFLLDKGASPDIVNSGGYTPLLGASTSNHGEIVRLLVEKGANIDAKTGNGQTPLSLAVWNDDTGLTKFLLDKGADANVPAVMGVSLPYFAMAFRSREIGLLFADKVADFAEKDSLGLTMLHFMAARGFEDLVETFISKGVAPDVQDRFGKTPLAYASAWGHQQVVNLLRARGARPNDGMPTWFKGGYQGRPTPGKTPIEFAGDELRTPFAPHGGMAFSPDGKEMLWCDHGPNRAAWYIKQVNGVWQQPGLAPFIDLTLDHAPGHPSFSADGNRIYYHSRRDLRQGEPGKTKSDIWFVEREGSGWSQPISVGSPINTEESESGPTVTPSGNLYFVGEGYKNGLGAGDIYVSELVNGTYTTPRNLGPSINSEDYEMPAAVSSDESYIIFASNRPEWGRQDLQLYVSFKANGEWTKAVSLGRTINRGDTWEPFISADDRFVFYFQDEKYYWFNASMIEDIREAVIGPARVDAAALVPTLRRSEQVFEHAATNDIALGDLDKDGDLDAVFSNMAFNDSRVYLNDGHGQFTATEQLLTQQGHGVDLGDLDADGDLDIFMTCAGYTVDGIEHSRPSKVYFNDGRANFTVSPQDLGDSLLSGNAIELHDIDTDGDLDAMILYYQEDNGVYLNDGRGRFTRSDLTFPDGSNWADVDNDGDIDILARVDGVGFKTLLNDGTGHFTEHWSKADSGLTRGGVRFGDFDKDGDLDAVVSYLDQSERRFSTLWYNDGTGRFNESDVRLPLTRYAKIAVGDLNGDGHLDVFLNNFGLPSAVWLNDGKGRLFDSGIRLPGEWQNASCPLGDVDGDGDLDVFVAAFGGGANELWFNDK